MQPRFPGFELKAKKEIHNPACREPYIEIRDETVHQNFRDTSEHVPKVRESASRFSTLESEVLRAENALHGVITPQDMMDTLTLTPVAIRASLDTDGPTPKILMHGTDKLS